MFETVLFPTDGSVGAFRVLDHVLDLAARHDATLHVLTVVDREGDQRTADESEAESAAETDAEATVAEVTERADGRGVETHTAVRRGEPFQTIVDYADGADVDLIAMPTHGRSGLERLFLGSTTERVVRHATAPVLTVRPSADRELAYPYRRVLVPTDGSECANEALGVGSDLAVATDARLDVLSVVDVTSFGLDARVDLQLDQLESSAQTVVDDAVGVATDAGLAPDAVTGDVRTGTSPVREINAYVDDNDVDLVVVGTHGRTGLDRYLLGSVTEKLLRTTTVPVMTVHGP
ncbi:MAG: universal stress protein [Haloquadratum sp.]